MAKQKEEYASHLNSYQFLVTGGAGFIGSHIVRYLLDNGAGLVRVLDNFSTGSVKNITMFSNHPAFELINGDIRDPETCKTALNGIHFVSHQAALGSVPRSIADPITTNSTNADGFLNILWAAKNSGSLKRFVFASSSSVYGDNADQIKTEEKTGSLLSPYAVTKYMNEVYALMFSDLYGIKTIGLRYFNVFGPNQSPEGAYAAVIPLFIKAVRDGSPAVIFGDGEQRRDFTFVDNVVQANIKSFFANNERALNQIYNVGYGAQTSVNQLLEKIYQITGCPENVIYKENRVGDIKNSLADIAKACELLDYKPVIDVDTGLQLTLASWV